MWSPVLGRPVALPLAPAACRKFPRDPRETQNGSRGHICGKRVKHHELVERILGQQHSGPPSRRKRTLQSQTEEQRGKRDCALTARGSVSKAMKGRVCGAAQASADCPKNWTTALIPRISGCGAQLSGVRCAQEARTAWEEGRYKAARGAMKEQGRSKTGLASLPSAPGPTVERQEYVDAVISFAIFHQLIFDEWTSGSFVTPLVRIKVDEKTVLE